ncbi:hypothetical protein PQ478_08760 [Alkalihalophilus pseudofirmus]|uniref:hypothetical protein n=1 Tax=Alkalihalophilus pseudofirmus TaxID=79885 RepID=UPI00259B248C|nr:hypothetical protein [Alkalihalophilus pseudofirmus]WEG18560.1 hypothetical protein PQ478_08760 [Alkalihalophilus pseudofirmus]
MEDMTLGKYIKKELFKRGIPMRKVTEISGTNVKTLHYNLNNDSLRANELLAAATLIGIDLNEVRKTYYDRESV